MTNNGDIKGRVPPQDLEAEKSVLGAILLKPDAFDAAAGILDAGDFYLERHTVIFDAIGELAAARVPLDETTLLSQLNSRREAAGGISYIGELASFVPTAANIEAYARTVREKAILRAIISTGTQLATDAFEATDVPEFVACAEYDIARIASRQVARPEASKASALATALWKIEHGQEDSVLTGFAPLDQSFGGFNVGHLTILAARTSRGKTAFATNVAINAAKAGASTAYFTLEMTADEMWTRALGCEGQVDLFSAR